MPGPGNVGERVRNLRLTRRLSQAQLAAHDLSDSYISLIESGKRTPTPAVLRLLAERLGCTPEFLSDGIEPQQRAHLEVRERYAELALLSGDTSTALAEFDEVIEQSDDPELTVRAVWGRARALEATGRLEEAIRGFEGLREQAEREPGRASWLPPVIALARCYHAVGDLGQAISLGERALEHLHRLGLTAGHENTELGRVLLLAYVDRSEPGRAHELGRRMLVTAEPAGPSIAAVYRRASSKALSEGSVGDALYFADRAIAVHGEDERPRSRARLRVAGARALLRGVAPYRRTGDALGRDAATEALELLRGAAPLLTGAEATECALETARALILVGELDEAVDVAQQAIGVAVTDPAGDQAAGPATEPSGDPAAGPAAGPGGDAGPMPAPERYESLAPVRSFGSGGLEIVQAWLIIARARLGQDDRAGATSMLDSAADRLDRFFPGRPTAQLFRELGELSEAAGDTGAATTAYRRALEATGLRPATRPEPAARDLADR